MEEAGDFVHVEGLGVAVQHVFHKVQSGVGDGVRRTQYREICAADGTARSASPKLVDTFGRQALQFGIPELKMQFDGERDRRSRRATARWWGA